MKEKRKNTIVGFSVGDLNGIGIEVILKALSDSRILDLITPVIYGSDKTVDFYKNLLPGLNIHFNKIKTIKEARPKKVNLLNVWEDTPNISPGESSTVAGEYAFKSLQAVTNDLAANKIDIIVTAPINKKNIQSEQFSFPGHTEFLTQLSNADESLMLMVYEKLKIGIATNHLPLSEVNNSINKDLILNKISLMSNSLELDFGINKPKIAVLGLNPHAGENGMLGKEESEIIKPAIEAAESNKILAFGPFPADGFFGSGAFHEFDGILAMYHDQGLVPFKTIAGGRGVNFTAGLPIVRTSPDHGTGYDISGKNLAKGDSIRNAIYLAVDIYRNRTLMKEISQNILKTN